MIDANRQYYETMESLFTSPAWKTFADDIAGWQAAIAAQWRTLKPEQLAYEQGRYAALAQVMEHAGLCESLKAKELEDDLENV